MKTKIFTSVISGLRLHRITYMCSIHYSNHIKKELLYFFKVLIFLFLISGYVNKGVAFSQVHLKLPSGTKDKAQFGAYYIKLVYTPEWDEKWPVSDVTDVVVRFDTQEPRFVFWRGTSYIPCWATYNGAWFTNEFFERRGGAVSGTTSMVEPMSDKQCRYSNVRIIENTDARVVIHWRYAPVDLDYTQAFVDPESHWGDWADEYYYIYPDAVGVRKATLHTSALNEWIECQESIVINQPGTIPEDNLNLDAISLYNLKGEKKIYTWTEKGSPGLVNPPEKVCIQKINFKSEFKPFTVVQPENVTIQSYGGSTPGSHFNFFDHWPVSQTKSDTRAARSSEKPSHTSLSQIKWPAFIEDKGSRTWIMLNGMINADDNKLVSLAKSWINPAGLKILSKNYIFNGYDPSQRAYLLSFTGSDNEPLEIELSAGEESPVVNPAFVIKNWGNYSAGLKINGTEIEHSENFRTGKKTTLEGTYLIVWIRAESTSPIKIILTPFIKNIPLK